MTKITGKNDAVLTSVEDIISSGGTLTLPTTARIHTIVSNSAEDDYNGILQVDTATIAGTIDPAGAGDIDITIEGILVVGSPLLVPVAVANNDTASQVATKVRAALNLVTAITSYYTVGGTGVEVSLTTLTAAANDPTLNIASATGTAIGLTPAASSVNTTAGVLGTGAKIVEVTGVTVGYTIVTENIVMNGTTPVSTSRSYYGINSMRVLSTGSGGKNAGLITATAVTDATVTSRIEVGENKSEQAFYMNSNRIGTIIKYFYVACISGDDTTIYLNIMNDVGVWTVEQTILLSGSSSFIDIDTGILPTIPKAGAFKVSAVSTGTSEVIVNFNIE